MQIDDHTPKYKLQESNSVGNQDDGSLLWTDLFEFELHNKIYV